MGIFDSVAETINRYGSSVKIFAGGYGGNYADARAFVQPLRYKNRIYVGGEYHRLGYSKTDKYLYIGLPKYELTENHSVIEAHKNKYIVKRCEMYYLKDNPVYVWAILQAYGDDLEDDYESD